MVIERHSARHRGCRQSFRIGELGKADAVLGDLHAGGDAEIVGDAVFVFEERLAVMPMFAAKRPLDPLLNGYGGDVRSGGFDRVDGKCTDGLFLPL